MSDDERQIRELVRSWLDASRDGDTDKVLAMMTDDVVFLLAGRPPMRKAEFEATSRAQSGAGAPAIDGRSEIREVQVCGDWAFLWQQLTVTVTPPGAEPVTRSGHTLTIFRKEDGRWRLARDANVLV